MSSPTFFVVDDEPISVERVLDYLQTAGKLQAFLQEILRQHAIGQAFQQHPELNPAPTIREQIVNDFRRENQLLDEQEFRTWLENNYLNYETLHEQLLKNWMLQQLKTQVSQSKLHEYFIQRKHSLDRFTLSWIVVNTQTLAEELYDQIMAKETSFDQLAKEYSFTEAENSNWMQSFNRGELRDELKAIVNAAKPGQIIEPLTLNNRWYLVRVDDIVKVSFEDVKEQLQTELYEDWLTQQVEAMAVKLEVTRWLYLKTSTR